MSQRPLGFGIWGTGMIAEFHAKALAEIAHRYGRNSAELAIAWVLRQPRVTAAIVGARKPGQIKETVFGGKFAIKPEDLARIDEALAARG